MSNQIDLSDISLEELIKDLCDNERDIGICIQAIASGITIYKDGKPIAENVKIGENISRTIKQEIFRRWKIIN